MKKLWNKVVACILVAAMGVVPVLSYADSMTNADVAELDSYSQEVDTSKISGDVVDPVDDSKVTVSYEEEAAQEETSDAAVDAVDEAALLDAFEALKEIDCQDLVDGFIHLDLYEDYENYKDSNYEPTVGDVVFFGEEDADSFGILKDIDGDAATVLESDDSGDATDSTYDFTEADVIGFGVLSDVENVDGIIENISDENDVDVEDEEIDEIDFEDDNNLEAKETDDTDDMETTDDSETFSTIDTTNDVETVDDTSASSEDEFVTTSDANSMMPVVINDIYSLTNTPYEIMPFADTYNNVFGIEAFENSGQFKRGDSVSFRVDLVVDEYASEFYPKFGAITIVFEIPDGFEYVEDSAYAEWRQEQEHPGEEIDYKATYDEDTNAVTFVVSGLKDSDEIVVAFQALVVEYTEVTVTGHVYAYDELGDEATTNVTATMKPFTIDKDVTVGHFHSGSVVTYELNVYDIRPDTTGSSVTITDVLPEGLTYVEGSLYSRNEYINITDQRYDSTTGTLTFVVEELPYGIDGRFFYEAKIDSGVKVGTSLTNTASVLSSYGSDVDSDTATISVEEPEPVLSVTKTSDKEYYYVGETVTYTITVTQTTPGATATNVSIDDEILNGLEETASRLSGVDGKITSGDSEEVKAEIPSLEYGETATLVITATVLSSAYSRGQINNTVNVSADDAESVSANVWIYIIDTQPQLSITKTADKSTYTVGDTVTYTIKVEQTVEVDNVNLAATNVVISDAIPAGLTVTRWSLSGVSGTVDQNAGRVEISNLPYNQSAILTITATVGESATGTTIVNTASVLADGISSISDSASIRVANDPALSITKTADQDTYKVGDTITYTIEVNQLVNGATADDVVITDVLPDGLTIVGDPVISGAWVYENSGTLEFEASTEVQQEDHDAYFYYDMDGYYPYSKFEVTSFELLSLSGSSGKDLNVDNYTSRSEAWFNRNANTGKVNCEVDVVANTNEYSFDADTLTGTFRVTYDQYTSNVHATVDGNTVTATVGNLDYGDTITITVQAIVGESLAGKEVTNTATVQADNAEGSDGSVTVTIEDNPAPVLSVTKTSDKEYYYVGETVTYTITVTQTTPGATAKNVVIDDPILNGLEETASRLSGVTGTITSDASEEVVAKIPSLAYGETATLVITATVLSSTYYTDRINNIVYVSADDAENVSTNVWIYVYDIPPELSITKSADKDIYTVGDTVTYTIQVAQTVRLENTDVTLAATNVVISDVIPAGLTVTNWSLSGARGTVDQNKGEVDISILSFGEPATLTITATVTDSAKGTTIVNTASAYADGIDSISDSASIRVANDPALSITKTADKESYGINDTVTYTITVAQTEEGATAQNVVITDAVPSGLTVTEWTCSGVTGTVDQNAGTFTIASLEYGQTATVTITATVNPSAAGTTIYNTASVSADGVDPVESTTVPVSITRPDAVLAIEKTADPATCSVGDTVTYTINVSQTVDYAIADSVAITDTLPDGLELLTATSNVGTPTIANNGFTLTVSDLTTSDTVTITVTARAVASGTITNTAYAETNGNTVSNTAIITVLQPSLSITKTANPTTYDVGDTVTYTITVTQTVNGANSYHVVVSDPLPTGLTISGTPTVTGVSGATVSASGNTVTADIGTMAYNDTAVITVAAVVGTSLAGTSVSNTATATDDAGNSESATATVEPNRYDFDLKSVDASDQILGGSEFAMYDSDGKIVYFTVSGSTYTVCDASATGATTTIAAGSVTFQGLLKDTYTITETQAPAGYLILTDEVTFSIDKDGISYVDGPAKAEDSRTLDIIHSQMALQMPSAGGVNSLLGVLIGCGVIGAGTAVCVSSRRRKKVKQIT